MQGKCCQRYTIHCDLSSLLIVIEWTIIIKGKYKKYIVTLNKKQIKIYKERLIVLNLFPITLEYSVNSVLQIYYR